MSRVFSRHSSSHSFEWKYLAPNALTALRLVLVVPFVHFALAHNTVAAGLTALAAILSDMDGTVARALDATSKFGSLFDPIVDICFMVVGFAVSIYTRTVLLWPVLVFFTATLVKSVPQIFYLRKHGKVKSVFASKTMGMIGFGSLIAAAFGAPYWLTTASLLIGSAGYGVLAIQWWSE